MDNPWLLSPGEPETPMKKRRKVKSTGNIKVGAHCPSCGDDIFSMHRHDFRRCMCGKVFVDGGDEVLRIGAEPPVLPEDVIKVYRPLEVAAHSMSETVRNKLPMAPPPLSFFTERQKKHEFIWHWTTWSWPRNLGPYPERPAKYAGAIYRWVLLVGPLEIRRWAS